ncbi:MAG: tetratricopeptide repeat protein [Bacteroidetes bacterium]|nr:tetratricopeptide repeat protein [Bacteroidota bacterium]MDA0904373.1 tetratricopeptide repeat protein [Bacteroidota bacterium]MDA1243054.1 tetratricopeptide repeat protein [Bacteroidota bacterium]
MAKKSNQEDVIVNVDELYTQTERFVDKNRKQLTMGLGAVSAVILLVIGYTSLIVAPAEREAEEAAFMAEHYFAKDSADLAMLGDGLSAGLEEVLMDHAGTPAAARAAFELGIIHRDAARFQEAVEAFEQCGFDDDVFGPLVESNIGDCLVELGNLDEAERHFAAAANRAAAGLAARALAPMCAYKQGLVLLELGKEDKAQDVFESLAEDFPNSTYAANATGLAASLTR